VTSKAAAIRPFTLRGPRGVIEQLQRFISLLEWLAQLGNAAGMEEWHKDSEAARFLLGRLRNDHA
jgi:hypothetical protein